MMAVLLKLEVFDNKHLVGVLLGILGTTLTALHDERNNPDAEVVQDVPDVQYTVDDAVVAANAMHDDLEYYKYEEDDDDGMFIVEAVDDLATTTQGDLLAVLAAICYATYTIQVRLYCPKKEELYSLELLLGYIGLVSFVFVSPLVLMGVAKSSFGTLSWDVFLLLLVKGFFDFIVSDFLYFRSIVYTSPTVASVGLALSVPLAFLSDLIFANGTNIFDWFSIAGALSCIAGFLFVNLAPGDHGGCSHNHHEESFNNNNDNNKTHKREESDRDIHSPPTDQIEISNGPGLHMALSEESEIDYRILT
jgi:solute carrier family 35 protein F5